jgi:CHAT domain-containing protein/lipopolysaccharide biosynthesis regulator YciM
MAGEDEVVKGESWPVLLRQFVAIPSDKLLQKTISAANGIGDDNVAALLRTFQAGMLESQNERIVELVQKLADDGRREEGLSLALLLDWWAPFLVQRHRELPSESQKEFLMSLAESARYKATIAAELGEKSICVNFMYIKGYALNELRESEAAVAAYEEALAISNDLAIREPEKVKPVQLAMILSDLGTARQTLKQMTEAIANYEQALTIYHDLEDHQSEVFRPKIAHVFHFLGIAYAELGQTDSAVIDYEKALNLYRKLAEDQPNVYCSEIAGILHNLAGEYDDPFKSRCAYVEAVAIYRTLVRSQPEPYRFYLARTLFRLANTYSDLQSKKKITAYKKALAIYRELAASDPEVYRPEVAKTLNNLAFTLRFILRQPKEAIVALNEALAINREFAVCQPDIYRPDVAMVLDNLGEALNDLHQGEAALKAHGEALAIRLELAVSQPEKYRPAVALTWQNLGITHRSLRQMEAAVAAFEKALAIYRNLEMQQPDAYGKNIAGILNDLANAHVELGQIEEAVTAYEKALTIRRRQLKPDRLNLATLLSNLGSAHKRLGHTELAAVLLEEALTIIRAFSKEHAEQPELYRFELSVLLMNLGVVLLDLDHSQAAVGALEEALVLLRELAQKQPEMYSPNFAMILMNVGAAHQEGGQLGAAVASCKEALAIYRGLAEHQPEIYKNEIAAALNNLGNARRLHEQDQEAAVEDYKQALEILRELAARYPDTYRSNVAETLVNLANAQYQLNQGEGAIAAFEEAISLFNACRSPRVVSPLTGLGTLHLRAERWEAAAACFQEAAEPAEQLRREALSIRQRSQLTREHINLYENWLTILLKLKRPDEALIVAERGRSRTLLELFTSKEIHPKNASPEQVADYERLLSNVRALEVEQSRLSSMRTIILGGGIHPPSPEEAEAQAVQVRCEYVETLDTLRKLEREFGAQDPDFLTGQTPLELPAISALAQETGEPLAIFRVTAYSSVVFLVYPDGHREVLERPDFTAYDLYRLIVRYEKNQPVDGWMYGYFAALDTRGQKRIAAFKCWRQIMETTLMVLHDKLLGDIHRRLKNKGYTRAVFVPNRQLAILPLHASCWMENGEIRYLADDLTIRYAPSLTVFKRLLERDHERRYSGGGLAGVADPRGDLRFSRLECAALEGLFPADGSSLLWHHEAGKVKIIERSQQAEWLHFACHGSYNLTDAYRSLLVLAGGEELNLGEIIRDMDLSKVRLVTLSACETGLTDFRDISDEQLGLAAGFLYAGAPTVWASLWAVGDESAALLMIYAYDLLRKGQSKAEALHNAQCWLRRSTRQSLAEWFTQRFRNFTLKNLTAWIGNEAKAREVRRIVEDYPDSLRHSGPPNDLPYKHPYHWAGFQCIGAG